MDNPLTPKKIQRLIHYAEDRSFNMEKQRLMLLTEEDVNLITAHKSVNKSTVNCESSSGILDLDRMEGFGESGVISLSLSKSTAFNPGEMTGRSTGTEEVGPGPSMATLDLPHADKYGRYSLSFNNFTNQLEKQTTEVQDIVRHSVASNFSFHTKPDLTADEASFIAREAPLPVQQSTYANITESGINSSNLSVGTYFKNRCLDFGKILGHTDSPDKSNMMPSITEVSSSTGRDSNQAIRIDDSLDCVPVRQPRNTNARKLTEHQKPKLSALFENPQSATKEVQRINEEKIPEPISSRIPTLKSINFNPPLTSHKQILLKNLHSSLRFLNEDTEQSVENSFSISKIADYLGKQSEVSITDMLQLNQKKPVHRKQPLTELQMNTHEKEPEIHVTYLKDSGKTETASSVGTLNTVISVNKVIDNDIPEVVITQHSLNQAEVQQLDIEEVKTTRAGRSKSPSSKSQSTLSTVRDNFASFKSGDSPVNTSQGDGNKSKLHSPNIEYKELDKSVDWGDVLHHRCLRQEGLAKEKWADVVATEVNGFVGVSTAVTITVTTLSDSWLTAKFQFDNLPNDGKDVSYELPRLPLLLSPKKSEQFTLHLTSNIEMDTTLPFTILLRDTSIDGDLAQKGNLKVNFKIPTIQAMSCDGMNKMIFPPVQESVHYTKTLVLISDCSADLQLELIIAEGDSVFSIRNVQEIRKNDVNKILLEKQGTTEDQTGPSKSKGKPMTKQLCRLTSGNAIKVIIAFTAPKLSELQLSESNGTFSGVLSVNLIGVNTVLRKVELVGVVGTANLVVNFPSNKLYLSHEPTGVSVSNTGSVSGVWVIKTRSNANPLPFKVSPSRFEVQPGTAKVINMAYTGPEDCVNEATIIFEDITTGSRTILDITGGTERPKTFPIKTNHMQMSWVRPGRKEISLKNALDKKIHIRCQIVGEGFSIDLPGVESRGIILPFSPLERRPLPIIFTPNSSMPFNATLHLVYDKNSDYSRKVKLFGWASGEPVRWSGLVTYGDTALVRAVSRAPIDLKLYNRSAMPAFVSARVHFNLQYMSVESSASLSGASRVVGGRAQHTVSLRVDWTRVERHARECATTALATVTVLTGAEFTRRRILRILKDESTGELDTSSLPDHLKVLAGHFDGEDESLDNYLTDFHETKASLNELIGGLHELTAQIDLPQDFADENNTVIITDDTVVDHHTLCD